MAYRSSALPSTASLRAFDAAARHASFTGAAAELDQTQGAISHQIRELETRVGARLFSREARGIELTQAGRTYLPYVRDALERLRAGDRALWPAQASQILTVSCSPNFAQKWLVPRLGGFLNDNPELDLRISANPQHISFDNDGIDLAIRHGNGHWPDLHVTRLCEERIFPVCSAHLDSEIGSLSGISDLHQFTLIHDQNRENWANWLRANDADLSLFDLQHGPVFSQTSLAIDAAVATQGIALARSELVRLDLAAGRLIRPVTGEIPADFAYWIVCPNADHDDANIACFRRWLLEQVQTSEASAAASG